jgi:AraC-like DNA-binding protein
MPNKRDQFTASNFYISSFYHLAVKNQLDADGILLKAGIDPEIVDSPSIRVDSDKLAVVVLSIWEALGDEAMSLSDSPLPRGSFLMMGKMTVHEPTLGKALKLGIRFYEMISQVFKMDLVISGDRAIYKFNLKNPELDRDHLLGEINVLSWHRYASWLIAESLPIDRAYFDFSAPNHAAEYTYLFPCTHVFNASYIGFSFPSKYLEYEIVQNTASLRTFMMNCPLELFLHPKTDFSVTGELQLLLKRRFEKGLPTIDQAAESLHMTKRTLIRKLKDEGSSYQKIKDLVRRDRAIHLLTRHTLSVNEVAEKIGFSDSAVFARAFKVWTGMSPRHYKQQFTQH